MDRLLIRQKVDDGWGYMHRDGTVCPDVLEAAKFKDKQEIQTFVSKHQVSLENAIIEEARFSIAISPA